MLINERYSICTWTLELYLIRKTNHFYYFRRYKNFVFNFNIFDIQFSSLASVRGEYTSNVLKLG